jgi:ABC-type nitrate/sulfonate/bicarbonate transport system permease component
MAPVPDISASAIGSPSLSEPVARRGLALGRLRAQVWLPGILSTIAVLVLLELISRAGVVPSADFPPITRDFQAFFEHLALSSFWAAVGDTVEGWGLGLLVSLAIGIALGTPLGISRTIHRAMRAVIEFLRPVPPVALIPLAVLLYGSSLRSTVFLAAVGGVWPVLVQTLYGMQAVDPVALETARSFSIGPLGRLWHVRLPSALPYIATGVRVSSAVAFVMAVTAELVTGSPGLGHAINLARQSDAIPYAYVLLIATGLLGLALNSVISLGERRLLRWHPSQREHERWAA